MAEVGGIESKINIELQSIIKSHDILTNGLIRNISTLFSSICYQNGVKYKSVLIPIMNLVFRYLYITGGYPGFREKAINTNNVISLFYTYRTAVQKKVKYISFVRGQRGMERIRLQTQMNKTPLTAGEVLAKRQPTSFQLAIQSTPLPSHKRYLDEDNTMFLKRRDQFKRRMLSTYEMQRPEVMSAEIIGTEEIQRKIQLIYSDLQRNEITLVQLFNSHRELFTGMEVNLLHCTRSIDLDLITNSFDTGCRYIIDSDSPPPEEAKDEGESIYKQALDLINTIINTLENLRSITYQQGDSYVRILNFYYELRLYLDDTESNRLQFIAFQQKEKAELPATLLENIKRLGENIASSIIAYKGFDQSVTQSRDKHLEVLQDTIDKLEATNSTSVELKQVRTEYRKISSIHQGNKSTTQSIVQSSVQHLERLQDTFNELVAMDPTSINLEQIRTEYKKISSIYRAIRSIVMNATKNNSIRLIVLNICHLSDTIWCNFVNFRQVQDMYNKLNLDQKYQKTKDGMLQVLTHPESDLNILIPDTPISRLGLDITYGIYQNKDSYELFFNDITDSSVIQGYFHNYLLKLSTTTWGYNNFILLFFVYEKLYENISKKYKGIHEIMYQWVYMILLVQKFPQILDYAYVLDLPDLKMYEEEQFDNEVENMMKTIVKNILFQYKIYSQIKNYKRIDQYDLSLTKFLDYNNIDHDITTSPAINKPQLKPQLQVAVDEDQIIKHDNTVQYVLNLVKSDTTKYSNFILHERKLGVFYQNEYVEFKSIYNLFKFILQPSKDDLPLSSFIMSSVYPELRDRLIEYHDDIQFNLIEKIYNSPEGYITDSTLR